MERVRTGLRIPYNLNTWLIQEAKNQGVAKNALILQILWEWAERQEMDVRAEVKEAEKQCVNQLAGSF